jgi:hypothetical protein
MHICTHARTCTYTPSRTQVIGFGILLSGTLVYNEIVPLPCCGGDESWPAAVRDELHIEEEEEALIGSDS